MFLIILFFIGLCTNNIIQQFEFFVKFSNDKEISSTVAFLLIFVANMITAKFLFANLEYMLR